MSSVSITAQVEKYWEESHRKIVFILDLYLLHSYGGMRCSLPPGVVCIPWWLGRAYTVIFDRVSASNMGRPDLVSLNKRCGLGSVTTHLLKPLQSAPDTACGWPTFWTQGFTQDPLGDPFLWSPVFSPASCSLPQKQKPEVCVLHVDIWELKGSLCPVSACAVYNAPPTATRGYRFELRLTTMKMRSATPPVHSQAETHVAAILDATGANHLYLCPKFYWVTTLGSTFWWRK